MTELGRTDRSHGTQRTDPSRSRVGLQTPLIPGREIFDTLGDGIVLFDPRSGRILEANHAAAELFGYRLEALLSLSFWKLCGTYEGNAEHRAADASETAMAKGKAHCEARCKRSDGTGFWCEIRLVRPDSDGAQPLLALLAVVRDIGPWRAARDAARLTELKYRDWVRNLPKSAVMICDPERRLVLIDGPEFSLSTSAREEMEGRSLHEVLPADLVSMIDSNIQRTLAGESLSAESPYRSHWYTFNYVPIFEDSGTRVLYAMVVAVNITERHLAESALRQSEERFVRIFQSSGDAIIVSQVETGKIVEVNPGFTRVLGWERAEVLGKTAVEVGIWPKVSDRTAVMSELSNDSSRGTSRGYVERSARRKDGVIIYGLISLSTVELDGLPCYLFTFRDVTEHRRAVRERERLIGELTARNEEMEQFTFTVSHDLKSPLVTITGFLGMLERDLAAGDNVAVRSDIARIGSAATKMMRLLSDLLELSRVGLSHQTFERLSLSEVVREALELLAAAIEQRHVRVEVEADLPEVYGDRGRLVQVAQNLLENAIKYMGDQTEPRIEIGVRPDPTDVVCFVKDNGMGIDPSYSERIFGLFEKLNPRSQGTGVGLALVRRILESHGGRVWVEAGDERGSTFVFRLPRKRPSGASSFVLPARAPEGAGSSARAPEGALRPGGAG